KYPNLTDLSLRGDRVDKDGMHILADMSKLERVSFEFSIFNNDDMKEIAKISSLKSLNLDNVVWGVTADGIAELKKLPSLERLVMPYIDPKESDNAAKVLSEMPNLKELNWTYGKMSDAGLEELSKSKSIEVLNLKSSFNLTPKAVDILAKMQNLKSLNLVEV